MKPLNLRVLLLFRNVDVYMCREEADLLARALGCRLLRTSVKEDINVNAVFRHLAARCLAELRDQEDDYVLSNNGIHPLTISESSIVCGWEVAFVNILSLLDLYQIFNYIRL